MDGYERANHEHRATDSGIAQNKAVPSLALEAYERNVQNPCHYNINADCLLPKVEIDYQQSAPEIFPNSRYSDPRYSASYANNPYRYLTNQGNNGPGRLPYFDNRIPIYTPLPRYR